MNCISDDLRNDAPRRTRAAYARHRVIVSRDCPGRGEVINGVWPEADALVSRRGL